MKRSITRRAAIAGTADPRRRVRCRRPRPAPPPPRATSRGPNWPPATTSTPVVIVSVGQPTTLYVQDLVLEGVASSGWHTHSGPEYTVIDEGTAVVQSAPDCVPVSYQAGQAVFIPAGVPHVVRSEGPADVHAVVTYTLPADRPVRDDAPAACP